MYQVKLTIEGVSPLQQSKEYASICPKGIINGEKKNETSDDYEKRTWKNRSHVDAKGRIYHPGGAFKKALIAAARYNGEQISGQGKKTYTAKITSGVGVVEDLTTNCTEKDVTRRDVYASAMGGKGKNEGRVWKYFPTLENWTASTSIMVYDDIVTPEVLTKMIEEAGRYIGIGTWRPENGGEYGRFKIAKFEVVNL